MTLLDWFELVVSMAVLLGIVTLALSTRFVSKATCQANQKRCEGCWVNIERRLMLGNLVLADLCEGMKVPQERIQGYARALNLDIDHFNELRKRTTKE